MALQHDAVETDETRAVVAPRVQPAAQRLESRLRDETLHAAQQAAAELLLQEEADQPRDTLHGLQRDIADEPVADHDVDVGMKDAVALDEADVVQAAGREQLPCFAH